MVCPPYSTVIVQESAGFYRRSSMNEDIEALDTFPKLLLHHARVRPGRPAIREKELGIWQTWPRKQYAEEARYPASPLAEGGLGRGPHIARSGPNCPRIP